MTIAKAVICRAYAANAYRALKRLVRKVLGLRGKNNADDQREIEVRTPTLEPRGPVQSAMHDARQPESQAGQTSPTCKESIEALLKEKGKTPDELLILFPELREQPPAQAPASRTQKRPSSRARPKLKRYTHPNTGKTVESRTLNHKTLQAWKEEYGADTVRGWAVVIDESESHTPAKPGTPRAVTANALGKTPRIAPSRHTVSTTT